METHSHKFKVRLGLFVAGGIALFVLAIFIIGKQKNMFNPVFKLSAHFYNISGLQVGNNIRFSGINVGTVDNITIINDSTVNVEMLVRKEVHQFIKSDCQASIGSEGLIGDRFIVITQGSASAGLVKEAQKLESNEPIETDEIMASVQVTASNAAIISEQLAEILHKINKGKGTIGRLIQDPGIAQSLDHTMSNLEKSSKGLNENMEAAKHNIFFRGFYNKKKKAAEKVKQDAIDQKAAEQDLLNKKK